MLKVEDTDETAPEFKLLPSVVAGLFDHPSRARKLERHEVWAVFFFVQDFLYYL